MLSPGLLILLLLSKQTGSQMSHNQWGICLSSKSSIPAAPLPRLISSPEKVNNCDLHGKAG